MNAGIIDSLDMLFAAGLLSEFSATRHCEVLATTEGGESIDLFVKDTLLGKHSTNII